MEWISVKERLPPFYKDVIGCISGTLEVEQCVLKNKGGILRWQGLRNGHSFTPTHWQPLPNAPIESIE